MGDIAQVVDNRADDAAVLAHLEHLFGDLPFSLNGLVEVAWTAPGSGALNQAQMFDCGDLDEVAEEVRNRNSIPGQNTYISAGLRHPDTNRTARGCDLDVTHVVALWADFDDLGAAEKALAIVGSWGMAPTLIVQTASTPHLRQQFWWKLDEPTSNLTLVSELLGQLARLLGGDRAVSNVSRLMRAGGSIGWPRKAGRSIEPVQVFSQPGRRPYVLSELARIIESKRVEPAAPERPKGILATLYDNSGPERASQQERFRRTFEPGGWHSGARDFIASMIRGGASVETAVAMAPAFQRDGFSLSQTVEELKVFALGAAVKYAREPDAVQAEGERAAQSDWIRAYTWRPPAEIPKRQFLYGGHFIRSFVTCLFAPGAGGKSILRLTQAIAMATGRPLLGVEPSKRLRVAYWNGEDPLEETERRVAAILLHFDIDPAELDGWFFWGTGRESSIIIAEQTRDGFQINRPDIDRVKGMVSSLQLDVLIMDPFIKTHRVNENDNNAVDGAASEWAGIANDCNISVELVHHTTKAAIGREVRVEDGRGGGALLFAARSAEVLNTMNSEEAALAQIPETERRWYFRIDNGKANLAPPAEKSLWYRFHSVGLGNGENAQDPGDSIGVVAMWKWPDGTPTASQAPEKRQQAGRRNGAAETIMAALGRLQDEGRSFPAPADAPGIRAGQRAVKMNDLRSMAVKLGLVDEPHPDREDSEAVKRWQSAARNAWKRGYDRLTADRTIRVEGDMVWETYQKISTLGVSRAYDPEEF